MACFAVVKHGEWAYGSRWDVFRDYIGSNPEAVMKWLCGVNVDNESK